jgi:hypothetical protein
MAERRDTFPFQALFNAVRGEESRLVVAPASHRYGAVIASRKPMKALEEYGESQPRYPDRQSRA